MTVFSKYHWAVVSAVVLLTCAYKAAAAPNSYGWHAASIADDQGDNPEEPGSPNGPDTEPGDDQSPPDTNNRSAPDGENAPFNDWGCDDLAPGIPSVDSYGPYGACCDKHDDCYEAYGCTAASWFGNESAECQQCNTDVAACLDQPVGPGPSICASATDPSKKCGQYRSGPGQH